MRPVLATVLALTLAACGGSNDAPSAADQAKAEAAARDAANAPLPPEQDAATAKELEEDMKAWK